jgi:subtilisin family serine protease
MNKIKYITSLSVVIGLISFTPINVEAFSYSYKKSSVQTSVKKSKDSVKKTSVKKSKKKIKTVSYKKVKNNNKVKKTRTRVKFNISLDKSIPKINATIPHSFNFKGQDVYVVVIDTGVETAHPFLKDKVALEACFSDQCPNGRTSMIGPGAARPVHWHGTHVAGIVAGSNQYFTGVAPEAKIIAVNVFDPYGGAYDDDIIAALNWVSSISSTYNIASINMSLGSSRVFRGTCDGYIPSMTTAIANLKAKNIATVVSAGNAYSLGMSSPACISHSVSVAATSTASDKVTPFSNVSEFTTFSAPGLSINSSKLMSSYGAASGTSMAAPHVAGAFAVYRSKFGVQSVNKAVTDFQSTAVNALDEYTNIITKRIDFTGLFSSSTPNPAPPLPSPPVTTTTLPSLPSPPPPPTTTNPPPPPTTQPPSRNFVTQPTINRVRPINSLTVGITLRYHVINSLSPSKIIVQCSPQNSGPSLEDYEFQYSGGTLLNYQFTADLTVVKYCRAVAIASNGTESRPTDYVLISK